MGNVQIWHKDFMRICRDGIRDKLGRQKVGDGNALQIVGTKATDWCKGCYLQFPNGNLYAVLRELQ